MVKLSDLLEIEELCVMARRSTTGADEERNTRLRRPENRGLTFAIRTEVPSFFAIGYFDHTATNSVV